MYFELDLLFHILLNSYSEDWHLIIDQMIVWLLSSIPIMNIFLFLYYFIFLQYLQICVFIDYLYFFSIIIDLYVSQSSSKIFVSERLVFLTGHFKGKSNLYLNEVMHIFALLYKTSY